jgi:hypothetical protein
MKKNVLGLFLCCALLAAAPAVARGNVAGIDVTISDAAGRLVYRGKTDGNGAFATARVAPGNYVVQFNARNVDAKRKDYAIFAAAGRHRVVADEVEGAKFTGGGVAMRLKVAPGTPIIGQVALGGVHALGTKIVNGRRYVLLAPETGTHIGPRWVEEGAASARSVSRVTVDETAMIKQEGSGALQ